MWAVYIYTYINHINIWSINIEIEKLFFKYITSMFFVFCIAISTSVSYFINNSIVNDPIATKSFRH